MLSHHARLLYIDPIAAMYPAISTRWRSRNHALPPRSRHIYCALAAHSPLVSSVTCLQCSFRHPYRIHARCHPVWQSRQSIKRGTAAGGEGKSIVFCQSRSPVPCRAYPPSAEDGQLPSLFLVPCRAYPPSAEDGQLPRSAVNGVTAAGGEGHSQSRSAKAGLQFSVGRIHCLLKMGNYQGQRSRVSQLWGNSQSRPAKVGLQFPVGCIHRLLKTGSYQDWWSTE